MTDRGETLDILEHVLSRAGDRMRFEKEPGVMRLVLAMLMEVRRMKAEGQRDDAA